MGERAIVARLAEREDCLGLDKVALVAGGDDVGKRRRRSRIAAKITECAHHRTARLRMRQLESFEQRVQRRGRANRAERRGRIRLHAPEFVGEHRLAQSRGGLPAPLGAEFASRCGAADRFGSVAQLGFERLASALVLEGLYDVVFRIEAHRLGRLIDDKIEALLAVLYSYAMAGFMALGIQQRDRDGNAERRSNRVARLVRLLDRDAEQLLLVVEGTGDFNFGMPFLVHPLVEEKIEVAAGGVLERALQVLRDDVGAAMPRAIEIERLEEQLVAA